MSRILVLCGLGSLLLAVAPLASAGDEVDTNKALTEFIWNNIIQAPTDQKKALSSLKSSLDKLTASSASTRKLPLPASLFGSSPKTSTPAPVASTHAPPSSAPKKSGSSALSRRSSYSTMTNHASPLSESMFKFTANDVPSPPASKYFQDLSTKESYQSGQTAMYSMPEQKPNNFLTAPQAPLQAPLLSPSPMANKPYGQTSNSFSYSGPANSKSFFNTALNSMKALKGAATSQNSIYDMMPMPSYGFVKGQMSGMSMEGPNGGQPYHTQRSFEIAPMINEGKSGGYGGGQSSQSGGYGQTQSYNTNQPQVIEVQPDDQPIQIVFRSSSTRVKVKQVHTPIKQEEPETTHSEEEPQRVMHQLLRPVIQEVLEIIQPYRRVTQEVRPVLEEIHTVVSKSGQHGGGANADGPMAAMRAMAMSGHTSGQYGNAQSREPPQYPQPMSPPYSGVSDNMKSVAPYG